jgi:hypothetical protein
VDGVELGRDLARPVPENVVDGHGVVDGEREVEIGPAVAGALRQPADDRRGDYARIGLRQAEHVVASTVTVLDAEHAPIVADRRCGSHGRG